MSLPSWCAVHILVASLYSSLLSCVSLSAAELAIALLHTSRMEFGRRRPLILTEEETDGRPLFPTHTSSPTLSCSLNSAHTDTVNTVNGLLSLAHALHSIDCRPPSILHTRQLQRSCSPSNELSRLSTDVPQSVNRTEQQRRGHQNSIVHDNGR